MTAAPAPSILSDLSRHRGPQLGSTDPPLAEGPLPALNTFLGNSSTQIRLGVWIALPDSVWGS